MNLVRLGPEAGITFDPSIAESGSAGIGDLLVLAPKEGLIPVSSITVELGARALDHTADTAHWRQVIFHNREIGRLYSFQGSDTKRNMTPQQAELHRGELAKHLSALGVLEAVQQQPPDIEIPLAA